MKRWYQMRRRKGLSSPEISLTPLIDTAWVLLVVFMIASPVIKKEAGEKIFTEDLITELLASVTNTV